MERVFRSDETTTVETAKGKIKGFFCDDLYIFKGIPYARAERFCKPRALDPWEGELDATSFGYVCPLLTQERPSGELLVPHRYWLMDEDCQNLNVWTPGLDDQKRPVLVWIHGGGFESGSAIEHLAYEGENMSRYGDAVVVSINHRLNLLGYLDLSQYGEKYADSANAGQEDLIAALRWVKENIRKYTEESITNAGHNLNDLQGFCENNVEKSMVIIGSTGIGKTESALIWSNGAKTFFTLPIRISINAIYDRIENFSPRALTARPFCI